MTNAEIFLKKHQIIHLNIEQYAQNVTGIIMWQCRHFRVIGNSLQCLCCDSSKSNNESVNNAP